MATSSSLDLEGLGRLIRERRGQLQLTQSQLGERLGWVQERISLLEHGKYGMPSLPSLVRLTEVLKIPFGDLLAAAGFTDMAESLAGNGASTTTIATQYALQRLLAIDAPTLVEALNEASDVLAQAMGADKIDVFLYEPSSDSLVALGTSKTPMGRRQHELGLHREPLTNGGRTVEVYQTGRSYYTPRADEDDGMTRGVMAALGVRSFLAVPLRPKATITGVVVAESAHAHRFSQEEREFFEAATRWVAMVARRVELTESLARIAADEARRQAAEGVVSLLGSDLGHTLTPVKGCIAGGGSDRSGPFHPVAADHRSGCRGGGGGNGAEGHERGSHLTPPGRAVCRPIRTESPRRWSISY